MQTKHELARPCTAADVTWDGIKGGQCLNCGATGPNCYGIKHKPQPKRIS